MLCKAEDIIDVQYFPAAGQDPTTRLTIETMNQDLPRITIGTILKASRLGTIHGRLKVMQVKATAAQASVQGPSPRLEDAISQLTLAVSSLAEAVRGTQPASARKKHNEGK